MAKKTPEQDSTPDKAKVRIFFAEIEGSNESVREAVKAMTQAINRPVAAVVATPKAAARGASALSRPPGGDTEDVEDAVEEVDEDADVEPAVSSNAPVRKRGSGPKRDYNAGIELISDLNFRPDGKSTLREFFAEKSPKGDMEQVLVVIYYMQNMMSQTAIGPGHVRTALKDVNQPLPADLRSTLRNMKKGKAWLSWSKVDAMQVTTIGENHVEHDMPARKS